MTEIHPTAIVSAKAKIGNNVTIGPYSIIHDDVEIGNDTVLQSHVVLYDGARVGNRVKLYQGVSVANSPQDLKFGNEITYFFIGDDTHIREFVTLHRGTHATGKSSVGSNCLLMAYTHVAHDCTVGNNVIIANATQIGGHCEIDDYVTIGGVCGIHQFSKIGPYTMIASNSKIAADVPPFTLVEGMPARFCGLNKIGLRRRGFTPEQINDIKETYRILYLSGLNFTQAKERVASEMGDKKVTQDILKFIANSNRGIVRK